MSEHKPTPSREEVAQREIGVTSVSRLQAWLLIVVFLGLSAGVPIVQVADELSDRETGRVVPRAWTLFADFPEVGQAFRRGAPMHAQGVSRDGTDVAWTRRAFAANGQLLALLHRYEDELETHSILSRWLISPVQACLLRTVGQGNEKAYPGRDGWAFFRSDIEYLTGPAFLAERQLRRRADSGSEWVSAPQPDPIRAILAFKDYLFRRGIPLVIVPTPVKPSIHAEKMSRRYDGARDAVQNPSFGRFVQQLEQDGVLVFDPAPGLARDRAETGMPQYLETDTHWRPEAIERTAGRLARFLHESVRFDDVGRVAYERRAEKVTALGDIAVNLLQVEDAGIYEEQTVEIHPVFAPNGDPWESREDADILLLGDSFANIYSVSNLNWGQGAGLAEQLSYSMGRDVDVIALNDDGAHATRLQLAKDLVRFDRLAEKRVVVWQFAARELSRGDWRRIDWEGLRVAGTAPLEAVTEGEVGIRGRIAQVTRPPRPGSVTYKDCIIQVHLVEVSGDLDADEIVIQAWGMYDNVWTPAAEWRTGQELALSVTDWDTAREARGLDGMRQEPLDDPDLELIELPVFWAEVE